jgi:protein-tyrosine phosphatase
MRGYIDLHCHWVAGIDDGARSTAESIEMLRALRDVGFDRVCATPHMRPGMFDNTADELIAAFEATSRALEGVSDLPERMLSSEHWFDDIVFQRLLGGHALPYPGGRAALVEVPPRAFPARLTDRLADLKRHGLRPVLAHPERYEPVWSDLHVLDPLLDGGTVLLLDVASLAGKYGRTPRRTAETLLDEGYYYAACSDAHRPADADDVRRGILRLIELIGEKEATFLLQEGPLHILDGQVED